MDLDFDIFFYCWGEFLKCAAGVYTFLFIMKIHPNTDIRDQNLSPSKVVTFLCLSNIIIYVQVGIINLFLAPNNSRRVQVKKKYQREILPGFPFLHSILKSYNMQQLNKKQFHNQHLHKSDYLYLTMVVMLEQVPLGFHIHLPPDLLENQNNWCMDHHKGNRRI